jgi:hypothetical protein
VTILNVLRLLLVSLWLGAAVFFSSVVAPSVFSVLRAFQVSNVGEIAGSMVTRNLTAVNISGQVIGIFLLITAFVVRRGLGRRSFFLELGALLLMTISTVVGHWVIASKMRALRLAMILPVDQIAVDDPRRVAFNRLHGYSVTALSIAMVAALIAFLVIAYRARLNTNY